MKQTFLTAIAAMTCAMSVMAQPLPRLGIPAMVPCAAVPRSGTCGTEEREA